MNFIALMLQLPNSQAFHSYSNTKYQQVNSLPKPSIDLAYLIISH